MINNTEKCPCIDCITLPICRHKSYMDLLKDCILIEDYKNRNPYKKLETIQYILKPSIWNYDYTTNYITIGNGNP
jgi:hypothetical protein